MSMFVSVQSISTYPYQSDEMTLRISRIGVTRGPGVAGRDALGRGGFSTGSFPETGGSGCSLAGTDSGVCSLRRSFFVQLFRRVRGAGCDWDPSLSVTASVANVVSALTLVKDGGGGEFADGFGGIAGADIG